MSDYLNYYGRNFDQDDNWALNNYGYTYLGPTLIPPVPPTCGMTDRAGTGEVWYLMWDGDEHLVLTNQPPRAYAYPNSQNWNTTSQAGQDVRVYGPWDGPYMGSTGCRLGVTTASISTPSGPTPAGVPHLQFDFPNPVDPTTLAAINAPAQGPVVVAPYILGPQQQSYPEPTNYPAPGIPAIPGIPSTTPPPTGGGWAAFLAAYATNTPPLLLPANLPAGPGQKAGWHIQHYGG